MIPEEQQAETGATLERLIFLSDGVFAIAITLLVLEIKVPEIPVNLVAAQLPGMSFGLWTKILVYVISFLVVSVYWIVHQRIFHYIKRSNQRFVWLNLFFLMTIAFIPAPTNVIGVYGDQQAAAVFYAGSLTITGLFIFLIWWYATSSHRLVDKHLDPLLITYHIQRSLIAPVVFLLSIGISFLGAHLTEFFWLLIVVVLFPLDRYYRRRLNAQQQRDISS